MLNEPTLLQAFELTNFFYYLYLLGIGQESLNELFIPNQGNSIFSQ